MLHTTVHHHSIMWYSHSVRRIWRAEVCRGYWIWGWLWSWCQNKRTEVKVWGSVCVRLWGNCHSDSVCNCFAPRFHLKISYTPSLQIARRKHSTSIHLHSYSNWRGTKTTTNRRNHCFNNRLACDYDTARLVHLFLILFKSFKDKHIIISYLTSICMRMSVYLSIRHLSSAFLLYSHCVMLLNLSDIFDTPLHNLDGSFYQAIVSVPIVTWLLVLLDIYGNALQHINGRNNEKYFNEPFPLYFWLSRYRKFLGNVLK